MGGSREWEGWGGSGEWEGWGVSREWGSELVRVR